VTLAAAGVSQAAKAMTALAVPRSSARADGRVIRSSRVMV
jgi:hypothetical protein